MFQSFLQRLNNRFGHREIHVRYPHRQHVGGVQAPLFAVGAVAFEYGVQLGRHFSLYGQEARATG
jgi:hypothetical protein